MKRSSRLCLSFLSALGLFGCPTPETQESVILYQLSEAPPTLDADLINDDRSPTIRMSTGVAMAVACSATCVKVDGCKGATISTSSDAIEAHEVYDAGRLGERTFVLAAKSPGA